MEFYYESERTTSEEQLNDLIDYYNPYLHKFNYLYISWADNNSWQEWHTINTANVIPSSIDVMFDHYNETTEEYTTVYYNQTLNEFDVRQVAIETFYPYNISTSSHQFGLSQNYSDALDLGILTIEGFKFNNEKVDFEEGDASIIGGDTIEIITPSGTVLSDYSVIVVLLNFSSGAESDYSQFKMTQDAVDNHPESAEWTINDSLWVEYEFNQLDYYLLFEDYDLSSEDTLFENISYFRSDDYVVQSFFTDEYYIDYNDQAVDFNSFVEVNDEKSVLELTDFNLDNTYEIVIQKDDLTRNGVYDSYKYGSVNEAGEIIFHTLIQKASVTEQYTDKKIDDRTTEFFELTQIDWIDEMNHNLVNGLVGLFTIPEQGETHPWEELSPFDLFKITAKKTYKSETTSQVSVDKDYILIQKDTDNDGVPDQEIVSEQIYSYTTSTILLQNRADIYFTAKPTNLLKFICMGFINDLDDIPPDLGHHEYLSQYSTTQLSTSLSQNSLIFRDFADGELTNTRIYKDEMPNEITSKYDLNTYLETYTDDLDDSFDYNDITRQVPNKNNLLSLSHAVDDVPAVFDSKLTITSSGMITSDNILSASESLTVPGQYMDENTFEEGELTVPVIKCIPSGGVYYDNAMKYGPKTTAGYYYYLNSENNDHTHETILVGDTDGNIIAVGFDYDNNNYFEPDKRQLTYKYITRSRLSEDEGKYSLKPFRDHMMLDYYDDDDYNGYHLDRTFSDALFDVWKLEEHEVFDDLKTLTFDKFIGELDAKRIAAEAIWQVECIIIASVIPVGGWAVYAALNTYKGWLKEEERENLVKSQSYLSDDYRGEKILSSKFSADDLFGGTMMTALIGNPQGIYVPVTLQTDLYTYKGDVVLAPAGTQKTEIHECYHLIQSQSHCRRLSRP
jgi:hypothetical protein